MDHQKEKTCLGNNINGTDQYYFITELYHYFKFKFINIYDGKHTKFRNYLLISLLLYNIMRGSSIGETLTRICNKWDI